jgi:hypothetical protein
LLRRRVIKGAPGVIMTFAAATGKMTIGLSSQFRRPSAGPPTMSTCGSSGSADGCDPGEQLGAERM